MIKNNVIITFNNIYKCYYLFSNKTNNVSRINYMSRFFFYFFGISVLSMFMTYAFSKLSRTKMKLSRLKHFTDKNDPPPSLPVS